MASPNFCLYPEPATDPAKKLVLICAQPCDDGLYCVTHRGWLRDAWAKEPKK